MDLLDTLLGNNLSSEARWRQRVVVALVVVLLVLLVLYLVGKLKWQSSNEPEGWGEDHDGKHNMDERYVQSAGAGLRTVAMRTDTGATNAHLGPGPHVEDPTLLSYDPSNVVDPQKGMTPEEQLQQSQFAGADN